MADYRSVCGLCGDEGLAYQLFHCSNSECNTIQHSYCSDIYKGEDAEPIRVCNWCIPKKEKSSYSSQTVCSMCGHQGFPNQLFHCSRSNCRKIQHWYCGHHHRKEEQLHNTPFLCDWCIRADQQITSSPTHSYNSSYFSPADGVTRSAYYGGKIKKHHHHQEGGSSAGKRKYKLLKDVVKNSTK